LQTKKGNAAVNEAASSGSDSSSDSSDSDSSSDDKVDLDFNSTTHPTYRFLYRDVCVATVAEEA